MSKKKNKKKHNKKRNTAFLYEVLVREITKCVLDKDKERQSVALQICKEHFRKGTLLHQEKELYSTILETTGLEKEVAHKLLEETKREREKIDNKKLFSEQSALISKINKQMNGSPFANFVPGYKNLATIGQIFNKNVAVKERVLLEQTLVDKMSTSLEENKKEELKSIDNLTYRTFTSKFNEQYGDTLMEEQKDLITKYVMSFVDNGVELKYYLNEEIGRLKDHITESLDGKENPYEDQFMQDKANSVVAILEGMSQRPIDETMVNKVLKIQELVRETQNGN